MTESTGNRLLRNQRIAFVGRLGGATHKEARQLVLQGGGLPLERGVAAQADVIVLGDNDRAASVSGSVISDVLQQRIETGQAELINESTFWLRLGIDQDSDELSDQRQLFTPAMLAELLTQPVQEIRRWQRLGLLTPTKEVHRLAYFDFKEILIARQILKWTSQGVPPYRIRNQLRHFANWAPSPETTRSETRLLDPHLISALSVEGKQLLLRRGDQWIEPAGQLRLDFDVEPVDGIAERESSSSNDQTTQTVREPYVGLDDVDTLKFPTVEGWELDASHQVPLTEPGITEADVVDELLQLEDAGRFHEAIEWYRVLLARYGPRADTNFQLAELLYRIGDLTAARERYYMAIELDEEFVEARANLGCVLAELNEDELAIAAFQGALAKHDDYADVHYHLAKAYDRLAEIDDALYHWQRFIELAGNSPWADEARQRLDEESFQT
jgi:DNA-binding transcriptional MerR regulator